MFRKRRHSPKVAGDVGFWGGWHEKTIHHARKPPSPGIKPRPLERHAIGHHFAGEIPGKDCGRASVGRGGCLHHFFMGILTELSPKTQLVGAREKTQSTYD